MSSVLNTYHAPDDEAESATKPDYDRGGAQVQQLPG